MSSDRLSADERKLGRRVSVRDDQIGRGLRYEETTCLLLEYLILYLVLELLKLMQLCELVLLL